MVWCGQRSDLIGSPSIYPRIRKARGISKTQPGFGGDNKFYGKIGFLWYCLIDVDCL